MKKTSFLKFLTECVVYETTNITLMLHFLIKEHRWKDYDYKFMSSFYSVEFTCVFT